MPKVKRYLPVLLVLAGLALGGCAWFLRPLEAKLTANPTSGPAPLSVTFSAAGSTGPITSFTLDFGDGSTPYSGTDLTVSISHTYTTPGTYTAVLTVTGPQGATDTDSKTITVLPGTTASLSASPNPVPANGEVTFILQAEAAQGRDLVSWKFWYAYTAGADPDLQGTISGPEFMYITFHFYATPGTYTARFEVKDSANQIVTKEVVITVTTPAPEVSLTATPTSGPAPLDVNFTGTATAGTGAKLTKWVLNFGDGYSLIQEGLEVETLTVTVSHQYEQTGSYTATFTVWDNLGQEGQATVEIEVE